MMSDATEFALWKLSKGDRTAAEKRLAALEQTVHVREYLALVDALRPPKGETSA